MTALNLIPGQLSLAQLRDVYQHPVKITLDKKGAIRGANDVGIIIERGAK